MNKLMILIFAIFALLTSGCSNDSSYVCYEIETYELEVIEHDVTPIQDIAAYHNIDPEEVNEYLVARDIISGIVQSFLFEEAIVQDAATDVVVAQYVGSRPFIGALIEFEFIVSDRILGNAADRIFVYVTDHSARDSAVIMCCHSPQPHSFSHGVDYLLVLERVVSPFARTHDDGFIFISDIAIYLDDPTRSVMNGEPIYRHAREFDFMAPGITRYDIISYVADLTRHNVTPDGLISSTIIDDIVLGSPNILIVEIVRPLRLSTEVRVSDWRVANDLFYARIVEVLEGNLRVGSEIVVGFFADTANVGEQHLVAIRQNHGGSFFHLTSRNSHFEMEQRDEIEIILAIAAGYEIFQVTFDLAYGEYTGNQNLLSQTIIQYRNATPLTTDPTLQNYIFTGWYPELYLTNVTEPKTFTAQWKRDSSIWGDLREAIARAEALLPYAGRYTQLTWDSLISYLERARDVCDDSNAMLEDISTTADNLLSAINALSLRSGATPSETGQQPPETGQQPPGTGQQPPGTGQQPPETGQQPSDTGQQPPETG